MKGGKDLLVEAWPALGCLILKRDSGDVFQREPRREADEDTTGSNIWSGTSASAHGGAPLYAAD